MDRIRIVGLEVYSHHGVYPEENKLGQKFVVNADLYTDTRAAGTTDDLAKSIDYGHVCHFITELMHERTFQLIESAAEYVAERLLQEYSLLQEVKIELEKPWAPIGLPIAHAGVAIRRGWHTAYLSLGSNMGDKKGYLDMAVEALRADAHCRVAKVADYLVTEPYGMTKQDDFLNTCLELKTLYTPQELLQAIHAIEQKAGRERIIHWGPRTLDLDILLYDDDVIAEEALVIPHVEMAKREFVLRPLAQIAPYVMHPVLNKRVCELLQELQEA